MSPPVPPSQHTRRAGSHTRASCIHVPVAYTCRSFHTSAPCPCVDALLCVGLHHTIGDEAPPLEDDSFYNVISTSKMLEFPLVGDSSHSSLRDIVAPCPHIRMPLEIPGRSLHTPF